MKGHPLNTCSDTGCLERPWRIVPNPIPQLVLEDEHEIATIPVSACQYFFDSGCQLQEPNRSRVGTLPLPSDDQAPRRIDLP